MGLRIEKRFMEAALTEARLAAACGETPVGAVIVRGGEIVAGAHNTTEANSEPSFHAELSALRQAAEALGRRELSDCVLYVTMEPCPMCAGACLLYRIGAVAFGAYDTRAGAFGSKCDLGSGAFGPTVPAVGGIMEEECAALLTGFFRDIR